MYNSGDGHYTQESMQKNGDATQLTGSAPKIRDAMEDVSNRVEYLTKQYI